MISDKLNIIPDSDLIVILTFLKKLPLYFALHFFIVVGSHVIETFGSPDDDPIFGGHNREIVLFADICI